MVKLQLQQDRVNLSLFIASCFRNCFNAKYAIKSLIMKMIHREFEIRKAIFSKQSSGINMIELFVIYNSTFNSLLNQLNTTMKIAIVLCLVFCLVLAEQQTPDVLGMKFGFIDLVFCLTFD